MTSTNDGKDVKSIQTSAPKGKSQYIELYKSLEARLSEVSEAGERTKHLCEAWTQVHTLCLHSALSTHSHLLSWLQRHTARTILQTEWQSPKRKDERASLETAINGFISQCREAAKERDKFPWESHLVARGEWFKKVLDRPWDHPVLSVLLNPNGTPPTDDEVLKWLKEERGVTFVMRLHALVADKCDDIAVSLAAAVMERVRSGTVVTPDLQHVEEIKETPKTSPPVSSFGDKLTAEAGFTTDVWELLTDIEFVLLHKRDSSRCISLAKQTPLRSAYQLVERLLSRLALSPREKRLWKNAKDVAVLIAQVVIARCMVVPQCTGVIRGALYCCSRSLARALGARLAPAAAALAAPAASAKHLHTLASAVDAHFTQNNDVKMKPFVCELYVRAITAGMNELERLKLKTEKESEARQMEQTLSTWFVQLGTVLSSSDRIRCECTLTAFSVHPSMQMYERIKAAPTLPKNTEQIEPNIETKSEFGSWASDSRSQTNFVKTSETLNMKAMQQHANVLSTAILNEGEMMGLSPELCQDIAVLLSGPRVKTLTWDMDRDQLIEKCRIYMERTHGGTRALTTELKFLNLDPQQFMHLPEEVDDEDDIYYGIEKGYEHLVQFQDEFWNDPDDPERTESAHSPLEDNVAPRRKKKSKPIVMSSDDDTDPLSLVAENKRNEKKKERPHSKERSKVPKTKDLVDPLEINESVEKKEKSKQKKDKIGKEKKERKKKEKIPKKESLANLVGLKVVKKEKERNDNDTTVIFGHTMSSVSDSDYDSQGKSSMTSINSAECTDVLVDGLFSMDELNSPERPSQSDSIGLMKNNEFSVLNGKVEIHHPPQSRHTAQRQTTSLDSCNPPQLNAVSEGVKKSIYKLIDYRRQRGTMEKKDFSQMVPHSFQSDFEVEDNLSRQYPVKILNNSLQSSESKLHNALSQPKTPQQTNITPKGVSTPVIPQSFINKQQSEKIAKLKKEIDNLLSIRKYPQASCTAQSPVIQYTGKNMNDLNQPRRNINPAVPIQLQNQIKMKDLVTVGQERYGPYDVSKPIFAQSRLNLPVHRPSITETPGENNNKKFLSEINKSIDKRPMEPRNIKREIKPVSRVTPVMPKVIQAQPPQRAKPMPQQKKPDTSLNTFSRLSYMHKNKQADIRNKAIEPSNDVKPGYSRQTIGSKIDDFVWEHLQKSSSDQVHRYNTPPKISNEYAQNLRKAEMMRPSTHNSSMLAHILGHTKSKNVTTTNEGINTKKPVKKSTPTSNPKSYLSDQEQSDLINLLRQRSDTDRKTHSTVAQSPSPGLVENKSINSNQVPSKLPSNKSINIISSTIIKPPSKISATYSKSAISKKCIKFEDEEKPDKSDCNLDTKKSKETVATEWQTVMNAILAQKTPVRGPNALDVALNKSSFEKAFEDSLRKNHNVIIPEKIKDTHLNKVNTPKIQETIIKSATNSKNDEKKVIPKGKSILKPTEQRKVPNISTDQKPAKDLSSKKLNDVKNAIHKKPINDEVPKKCLNENLKKKIVFVKPTEEDPFISGIPNSDYDLIEELMDDDLRKEIGELSSDEENYSTPASLTKSAKPNEKRADNVYNKTIDVRQQTVKSIEGQRQQVHSSRRSIPKCIYDTKITPGQSKPQTAPICQKIVETCSNITTAPNVVQHNPQSHAFIETRAFAGNHMPNNSNMYVSVASQQSVSNVVLIGSNTVYDDYSTVQAPINTVTNMQSTAYVLNNVPNMTLYQPTQYVQPVINPVIIENTVTVPMITNIQCSSIHIETNTANNLIIPELVHHDINNEIQSSPSLNMPQPTRCHGVIESTIIQNNQFPTVNNVTRPRHLQEPTLNIDPVSLSVHSKIGKLLELTATDDNTALSLKQGKEIVITKEDYKTTNIAFDYQLKQDNVTNPEFKTTNISLNSTMSENQIKLNNKTSDVTGNKNIERKVLSEVQEKQVAPETAEIKVKYQTVDYVKSEIIKDEERLKNKRMAIINRKISHYSEENPIPLSYFPLSPVVQTTINESETESKSANENPAKEVDSIVKDSRDNCKENKSSERPCRRILLRSSNKLKNQSTTVPLPIKKKVTKKKSIQSEKSNAELTENNVVKNDEDEKLILNKRASKKKQNIVINKRGQPRKHLVRKVKLNVGKKLPLKTKNKKAGGRNVFKAENNTIDTVITTDSDFDIETAILGSKIPKTVQHEHQIKYSEILSNKSGKDEEKISTLVESDANHKSDQPNNDINVPEIVESVSDDNPSAEISVESKDIQINVAEREEKKEIDLNYDNESKTVENRGVDENQKTVHNNDTVKEDCYTNVSAIYKNPNTTDKTSEILAEQVKQHKGDQLKNYENVDNNSSENISNILKLKDLSEKNKNNEENTDNHRDKNDINSQNKSKIVNSEFMNDNNSLIPSVVNVDDVEVIHCTELLNESKSKVPNNISLSDIPQSYKDSICIEHLPNLSSDNPLKKCVRIKLPNGRVFKATIYGQVNVNFDTLFDQPSIKSVLFNNLKCKKRYTLHVKQVTTVSKHDQKVVSTQIEEVIPRICSGNVIDTVNLLSDDEDDDQPVFNTEFGKYKIINIDSKIFNKHKEKLKLKSVVELEKKAISNKAMVKNDSTNLNTIDLYCFEKMDVETCYEPITNDKPNKITEKAIEPLNKEVEVESTLSEVVLIDDSSDDDLTKDIESQIKDLNILKENLLKDLGVGTNEFKSKRDETNLLKENLLLDLDPEIETKDSKEQPDTPKVNDSAISTCNDISAIDLTDDNHQKAPQATKSEKNSTKDLMIDFNRQCYVKLVRCDEIVTITKSIHVKPIEQLEEVKLDCPKPRSRSNSLSILDDFPLLCDIDATCKATGRTSPVIEIFDFIASHESFSGLPKSLQTKIPFLSDPIISITCKADWFETKQIIHVVSKNISTVSSQPLTVNHAFTEKALVQVPSLTSVALKYLLVNDIINTLKPIGTVKDLKAPKRKSESTLMLTIPKISKLTMAASSDVCEFHDITDTDLMETSITSVLRNETTVSVESTDDIKNIVNDLINRIIDDILSVDTNGGSRETEYSSVSLQPRPKNIETLVQSRSDNPEYGIEINTAGNNAEKKQILRDNDIELSCEDKHEKLEKSLDTKINNGNDDISDINLISSTNIERQPSVIYESTIINQDGKEHQLPPENDPVSCTETISVELNITNVLNVPEVVNKKFATEIPKEEEIELKFSSTLSQNDEEYTDKEALLRELEKSNSISEKNENTVNTSLPRPFTDVEPQSQVIDYQDNSNLKSDGNLKLEMSVANAEQTIEKPLDSNAQHIITNILKLTGKEGSEVILKGIQYEDPEAGTCFMFPLIEHSDRSEPNMEITGRDDIITLIHEAEDSDIHTEINEEEEDSFEINVPTHTYFRKTESVRVLRNLKRKRGMSDVKIHEKRYRKGKNIDYPKFTAASMNETVYAKEYKKLIEYYTTVKFSYSLPFHKENIEVDDMLKNWPICNSEANVTINSDDIRGDLFADMQEQNTIIKDPLEQTLAQEINSDYNENNYKPINIVEANFNMGFGERSDRVIHYTKTEKYTSKLSAATLSDVKPYQPYSTSVIDSTELKNIATQLNDDKVKLQHMKLVEIREKVRRFFENTAVELFNDNFCDDKKSLDNETFPYGLTSTEFLTQVPHEISVNVVQVGQLPVSAAAQNPVTCDPRVTHVTNVSPSQCPSENSPGDDNQTPIKTEYTELTTADINLPLVQEYAHHLQQLSSDIQDSSETQVTDSNNCGSTEIKAQIKIELTEENSQERLDEEAYEQLTSASNNNNINNGITYNYNEISNNTYTDVTMLNSVNGRSINNNPEEDAINSQSYNNSTVEDVINGQDLNSIIVKEEMKDLGSDNIEEAINGQHNESPIQDSINCHINNSMPLDEAVNSQDLNNTVTEQPTNDRLNNTVVEIATNGHNINGSSMDGDAIGHNIINNTNSEISLNEQDTIHSNIEDPKNIHSVNTAMEEAINIQNINKTDITEATSKQTAVPDPTGTNTFSENNCNKRIKKTDQLAHAMNAAGISTTNEMDNSDTDELVDMISQNAQSEVVTTTQMNTNNFSKSTPINAMALQHALAQILPPPLNQTTVVDNGQPTTGSPPVLHIVQGSNTQTVINKQNGTPLLHIVQNKTTNNGAPTSQTNSFSGLSLVDTGLQQGGNQLLHIVNTGNQKNNSAGQLLKRVNLLTNITNVQGGNEQKMVQFVCKSADGKSIQLNSPHQRSMVLRLQPIDPSTIQTAPKPAESQDTTSNAGNTINNKDSSQQDIKSRSVYEENYAKFIQNGTDKPGQEKATSLPKFNQVFGKQVYQENQTEMSSNGLSTHTDDQQTDDNVHLDGINDINNPPLLLRKSPSQTSQAQTNLVQQIKQTITPMNIQTMHGGVIYTRQIPVNIGGGQTINLITVPSTELADDSNQKQQTDGKFIHQEGDHVIKIVPQGQSNNVTNDESNAHVNGSNEAPQNPQPQPVLTQMRIKLPMLSKTPHMVSGARIVRPSFFQIQRNVIGGANQPVYQQLVLTAAPPLGQAIKVPAQTKPAKPPESQSPPETQMSSSTLEQLREFDMVLEQVKERSTVNPGSSHSFSSRHSSADTTDSSSVRSKSITETTQVMYTTENNQTITSYVNRKSTVTSASTSSFVRSPDSSGIVESPSSSTQNSVPHTVTSESTSSEAPPQPKPKKKKKSSVSSSNTAMKMPPATPKPSSQKPLEDEQTTQRILYILAEYKEQVENSPDKDKPAPRRRNNLPPNLTSSKRKKSSSGSRRRDMSPIHGEDSCRTMGSEDSSCGTSLGECAECMESHSPEESPRKVVRKLTFEQETTQITQTRTTTTTIPQRNVIVADGQTITLARSTTGKPATTVLMPANYLLPVSMVKGGQQIAIVTNRGPKILVGGGEGGTGGALLLQRLIGPGGLKPVLTRPGVRHIRLPTSALHNLQAFNIATQAATTQPADSTASPASAPAPPDLVDTRAMSSPWPDREAQEAKGDRGSSPDGSEPWILPSSSIADDYGYEEIVRTDNMDRTVLDAIPDRYSPDMEAQRIFDKMFDVDSKKSMYDTRCGYDIDASDTDDRPYQVVQRRDGRHHRLTHVSTAALRHKYAILENELGLQKSLSEECEDLGVDSPSAAELFPEAELFFAPSPVHEQTIGPCHTPQPTILNQGISQPDLDDQIATDQLLTHHDHELDINLDDVGEIVTVGEDGMATIALDHEEFARSHPNTTFHTEPEEGEIPPFTISQSIKGSQITFHGGRGTGTVVMAPQTTVISQATVDTSGTQETVKFTDIDNMINAMPTPQPPTNMPTVLVKDSGLTRFDGILTDSRELHLSNTASAIVHSTGQGTQVIRRVRYDDRRETRYLVNDRDPMMEEKNVDNRDLESMAGDDTSSPERHPELFWESNSASERSEGRRRLDFSSDSDKCCKSPFDEASTDSSFGNHTRLDSVIKAARTERSGSGSSDDHPPLRTYPPKRVHHVHHHDTERSVSGKTRAGESCLDVEGRRRASNRGVVKRGCHCCNGSPSPAPPKPKKSRQKKPSTDFTNP